MKKAKCIRNAATWSYIEKTQKFDTKDFKKASILSNLNKYSPRMLRLIENIRELDNIDLQETGKHYKHVIYSDVQGIYGSKMIAAVLIANNYSLCYDKNLKLFDKKKLNNSVALLSSSVVYGKPFPIKLKKEILSTFNERPDGIYGKHIRFIIIDSGYKEGIDLFDVKYFHILEPLITKAEETQVLGRGIRFCGQAGLPFDPVFGWRLDVFQYNMMYKNDMDSFELYLKHSDIDISQINLSADLETLLRISAVDKHLIKNLGNSIKSRFDNIIVENNKYVIISANAYGKVYNNNIPIDCKVKCHGPLQATHNGLLLLAALHNINTYNYLMNEAYPKNTLCNKILKDKVFCTNINNLWMKPIQFLKKNGKDLIKKINDLFSKKKMILKNYNDCMEFINFYYNSEFINPKNLLKPPAIFYNYLDLQFYIKVNFKKFIWDKIKMENLCEKKTVSEDIKLTPTQAFVSHYFTPLNINKGILLHHSVGTGKTCAAIATSVNFVKAGYTIIWVTRHTLKQDVWKNMFDKVCNSILDGTDDNQEQLKLIKKNWFPILSYKQFTNLIAKKNTYYNDLVKINGSIDPFKKTLIIIDEVHKLFTNDIKPAERPDVVLLKKNVHSSYSLSKNESCKLVLLSATPITEDIMSLNKILNLILLENLQLPEDYQTFKSKYCDTNGLITTEGAISYINNISGIVSSLNRSGDIRQFAYPKYYNFMIVPPKTENYKEQLVLLENTLTNTTDKKNIKSKIKILKDKIDKDHSVISMIDNCL
jgi:hypothetical protein